MSELAMIHTEAAQRPGREGGQTVIDRPPQGKRKEKTQPPKMYKVLLHNDDSTPFDFVRKTLTEFFNFEAGRANDLINEVHKQGPGGVGVVGVYPHDIAETRVDRAMKYSRASGQVLQYSMDAER